MNTGRRKLVWLFAIAVALGGALWLGSGVFPLPGPSSIANKGVVRLALAAGTPTFLEQEAGISAYAKATGTIDLQKASRVYKYIERQTADYVIGYVAPEGYSSAWYVNVYVERGGWMVAFYGKTEPAARMVDIRAYSGKAIGNLLQKAIASVSAEAGVSYSEISYYDYRYPDANSLLLVGGSTEPLKLEIPTALAVSERSAVSINWVELDGSRLLYIVTLIPASKLMPGATHTFTGYNYVVALTYRE